MEERLEGQVHQAQRVAESRQAQWGMELHRAQRGMELQMSGAEAPPAGSRGAGERRR